MTPIRTPTEKSDATLVAALRAGDEDRFREIVDAWSGGLLHLARSIVRDPATAEELVQEAWIALIDGLTGFEGRSSLKTWLCQIVVNKARTRAARDRRSPETPEQDSPDEALFDAGGNWLEPVRSWQLAPDVRLEQAQARQAIARELERLPQSQRQVVVLRDIEGLSAEEACHILGLSETNQRQLLHRGRARLRAALAQELER